MGRPRQAGIVVLWLLGLSGCAGVPQRLSWTSPAATVADRADARPSTRFSWWRRPGSAAAPWPETAPDVNATSPSASMAENTRPSSAYPPGRSGSIADPTGPSSEVWPQRRLGLFRSFPWLGRRWNGTGRDQGDSSRRTDVSWTGSTSGAEVTAAAPPAPRDRQVQPVDAAGGGAVLGSSDPGSPGASPVRGTGAAPAPALSAARGSAVVSRYRAPEPILGEVALDVADVLPAQGKKPSSGGEAAVPGALGAEPGSLAFSPLSGPADPPPDRARRTGPGPALDPAAIPAAATAAPAGESQAAVPPSASSDPAPPRAVAGPTPEGDLAANQPPPSPPVQRLPAPPPPAAEPDAQPTPTPTPAPTAPAAPGSEGAAPPTPSPSQPSAAAAGSPAPAQAPDPGPGPRLIAMSAQAGSGYASTPPATAWYPRCNLLGRLCPFQNHGPYPSSQLPPALFPTSYGSCSPAAGHPAPTPQGCRSSCETTPAVKVKKPCFLQTWLHKKTCPGQGCGCCDGGCGAHQPAVTASQQCLNRH